MATRIWKDVLHPGRQCDSSGRWFAFHHRHIARAHHNVQRMLSRGVPIPCVWEHQDIEAGDTAAAKAAYARHTFGHIAGSRVRGGVLELLHEVPDSKDVRQLAKTRFVSPKVYPGYSDSRGGEYRGTTIAHVAATPTPVQFWQRPFQLSRRKPLYLSYRFEGQTVADEKEDEGTETGTVDGGQFQALVEALRESGLNIPDEVTDIGGLIIAVKASSDAEPMDDFDDKPVDEDDDLLGEDASVAPGDAPPLVMSDRRVSGYIAIERRQLLARADGLFKSGRVDKPTAEKLKRELDAVSLSFSKSGDLKPTRAVARLEAYEELPKGRVWSRSGRGKSRSMSSTRAIDPPDRFVGNEGRSAKSATEFLCEGLPAKKK